MDFQQVTQTYFKSLSGWRGILFSVGVIAIYALVFWLLYPLASRWVIVITPLFVLPFAQVLGWRGGLIAGGLAIPLNLGLYALRENPALVGTPVPGFWLVHTGIITVGLVGGYLRDLQKRLQVETIARENLQRELRQSVEKYQDIVRQTELPQEQFQLQITALEAAANGIVITDKSGTIQWVNPAFTQLTGYTEAEIVGQKTSILKSGEHDDDFYKGLWETIIAGGVWKGLMVNRRKDGTSYVEEQTITPVSGAAGEISYFIAIKQDVSNRVRAEKELEYQATHDPITNLPNYMLFYDRLKHAIQKAMRCEVNIGVLFLDLDDFKAVNDALGHAAGDELLRVVARRLQETTRKSDTVARVGGDEFTLILEELDKPEDAGKVAHKIIRALLEPYPIEGNDVCIGVSVGVSVYPRDGVDAATLVNNADEAMYRAKQGGKNKVEFY
jgi:diguanylate cyclase (GGDEF)-like protein/PAS domain S-box-containing protein